MLTTLTALAAAAAQPLPTLDLTHDNTPITQSCRIRIAPNVIIPDPDHNGVIHIAADDITVEFDDGAILRGAPPETPWDQLRGIGLRLRGHQNVTIRNAHIHGFKVGLWATDADGLTLDTADLSDNYRQRLKSTPRAEDASDWLFPHRNDDNEWLDQHGAAAYIEDSDGVTIRNVRVRRTQNGILLDRVNHSRLYDNDCSFLSGWGLGLWRSSDNIITRNALDFCVRGHVEGVYNRGQDSAGLLMFEQNNRNLIAENSITHGGDGIFGFAGREAIGEAPPPGPDFDYARAGNTDNLIIANDLSYAAAHGLEMTFSEGNVIARNRFVENAICGLWGGYSSDMLIAENTFEANGGMAYGLERGGVNIEHGSGNRILNNTFTNNKAAIHLWWDNDAALLQLPGVEANYRGVSGNIIAGNTFTIDEHHPFGPGGAEAHLVVLQLRDAGEGHVRDNLYADNIVSLRMPEAVEIDATPGAEPATHGNVPSYEIPDYEALGETRPVGARAHLRGRDQIIMGEWGPWDHESPLVRPARADAAGHVYEVFGVPGTLRAATTDVGIHIHAEPAADGRPHRITITARPGGVTPYTVRLTADGLDRTVTGTIVAAEWTLLVFPWTIDPREDLEGWRAQAIERGIKAKVRALDFNYGSRGPRDMGISPEVALNGPGPDRFGTIATTTVRLTPGRWRLTTLSDDGIRVLVDGQPVIENWTWHAPTRDTGEFKAGPAPVEIRVEHFEIDGAAALTLQLEPVR